MNTSDLGYIKVIGQYFGLDSVQAWKVPKDLY